jgi:hypothetical protein
MNGMRTQKTSTMIVRGRHAAIADRTSGETTPQLLVDRFAGSVLSEALRVRPTRRSARAVGGVGAASVTMMMLPAVDARPDATG